MWVEVWNQVDLEDEKEYYGKVWMQTRKKFNLAALPEITGCGPLPW